ncbi:MAG TPA: 3-hydroxybutyrate oligomer hydrolase family protein [Anaeromyxobacteraceae bacterium]|nr:3-hydroxybutyrate oligomer hydrolase family protein [Anaeromyxobacteraceae bacterium]
MTRHLMTRHLAALSALLAIVPIPSTAAGRCPEVLAALEGRIADAVCFESPDLTTNNALPPPSGPTTPANNSLPGLPVLAFTPTSDRGVISPDPPDRTPIAGAVPGIQIQARLAGDPTGEARFLLRLPDDWNGRLVVAGASGNRSEFNGDFAWSDYVVQKGYAYASQNKGILNLFLTTASDPLGCRLNPVSPLFVRFYVNEGQNAFAEWQDRMAEAARLARDGAKARYGLHPRHTFAVGTSNGGYQVRRAVEASPDLFDGGVDWEGTFVDPGPHNLLAQLPAALREFPAYVASGFDGHSAAAQAIRGAGYPPDIVIRDAAGLAVDSLWRRNWLQFWEVTWCQWQKKLDPTYDTYGSGAAGYDYFNRALTTDVAAGLAAFATTGKVKKPLVTVAGTMDALLPIDHHARAYAAAVAASRKGDEEQRAAQYRLYEVQNGNHIENYRSPTATFPLPLPGLELLQPHAHRAFDLLVDHVERGAPLPPDQCVPRGGTIAAEPAEPGHCAELLAP